MSIRFKQFLVDALNEAPIPDDWDKAKFSETGTFRDMLRQAFEKSKIIGSGSSRIAFVIPYKGRETVLKIAKNKKGLAQNQAEVDALDDRYLQSLNLVIPLIDYDEESSQPRWIHMEKALKVTPSKFKAITGGTPYDLVNYAKNVTGREPNRNDLKQGDSPINPDAPVVLSFVDYAGNYTHHRLGDYTRLSNWGLYNGNLVIVDIGLTDDVFTTYYSPKPPRK